MRSSALEESAAQNRQEDCSRNDFPVLGLLAIYFLLQLFSRVMISDTANLDESEQLILTQGIRWGYASQPPLYTWLQSAFFTVLGTNIFALALLKNLLIFSTYLFTYLSAKAMSGRKSVGAMAALGLLFIPQIVWETQRDLTHSVLTTTIASATIFIVVKLIQTGKTRFYMLLGVCAALGILSKYNYALFFFALLAAAISLRQLRPVLLERRSLATLGIFLLLTAPHFFWALNHNQAALTQSEKLVVSGAAGVLASYGKGLLSLITAAAGFFLPLALVVLLISQWPAVRQFFTPKTDFERFLSRTIAFGLCICVVAIFCFNARFKDRWMQPLLFMVPLYFALGLSSALDWEKLRRFKWVSASVAIVVLVGLPIHPLSAPFLKNVSRLNAPYSELAIPLKAHFRSGVIIAENRTIGGNLKLRFQESCVLVPELAAFPAPKNSPVLLVWDATKKMAMPSQLSNFASGFVRPDDLQIAANYVEAPLKYAPGKKMRLGFVIVPPR